LKRKYIKIKEIVAKQNEKIKEKVTALNSVID
jgi:hypothetical protein